MKKITRLMLLLTLLPISAFATNSFMYIQIDNGLDSYNGSKNGPLHHNIEYVVKPQVSTNPSSVNLSGALSWDSKSGDTHKTAEIFSDSPYPLSAELTITDQQTKIVLWHGIVSKDQEYGALNFSNHTNEIDDKGSPIYFHYFPQQITVSGY